MSRHEAATGDSAFVARQAAFLRGQGLDASAVDARLSAAVGADSVREFRGRLAPAAGSFRDSLARVIDGQVNADDLNLRGLALEQTIADAYLGLWRAIIGFALYALGIAAIATLTFSILLIFVVPQLSAMVSAVGGMHLLSRLVFELGAGTLLITTLWVLALWALLSTIIARRAILLRSWPAFWLHANLLRGVVLRHLTLLRAWTAASLLEMGVPPADALRHASVAVERWCGPRAKDTEADRQLAIAQTLGTLREELDHRVAAELVDAPLALAARRERLVLYAGIVAALLVAPLLVATYLLLFRTAAMV